MRMTTILRDGAKKSPVTGQFSINDYVSVRAIDTYGVWDIKDVIPAEQLAALAAWANAYEHKQWSNRMRMQGIGKGKR